jgi:hypothetical protein
VFKTWFDNAHLSRLLIFSVPSLVFIGYQPKELPGYLWNIDKGSEPWAIILLTRFKSFPSAVSFTLDDSLVVIVGTLAKRWGISVLANASSGDSGI